MIAAFSPLERRERRELSAGFLALLSRIAMQATKRRDPKPGRGFCFPAFGQAPALRDVLSSSEGRLSGMPLPAKLHSIFRNSPKKRMEEKYNGNYQFTGFLPVVYA